MLRPCSRLTRTAEFPTNPKAERSPIEITSKSAIEASTAIDFRNFRMAEVSHPRSQYWQAPGKRANRTRVRLADIPGSFFAFRCISVVGFIMLCASVGRIFLSLLLFMTPWRAATQEGLNSAFVTVKVSPGAVGTIKEMCHELASK